MPKPFDPKDFALGAFAGGYDPMKVSAMLTATLKLLGAIAKSEVPSADEMQDAFDRMNDMLDAWAADSLMIYQVVRTVTTLTAGKQTYTIGLTGTPDIQVPRPTVIQNAGIISTTTSPSFEMPVTLLSDDDWAQVTLKATQAALSWYLYYDYAFPNGNISLWPVPSIGSLQLALYAPTPVQQFADVNSLVALPPGYAEALRYNLAMRLSPEFGIPLDPVVAQIAIQSKRMVELANNRMRRLSVDASLTGAGNNSGFNWILGSGGAYW